MRVNISNDEIKWEKKVKFVPKLLITHHYYNIRRSNFTTETLEHVVLNNDKPRLSFSTYTVQLS